MEKLNLKIIRIDGGTQSRAKIDNETVKEYAAAIKAGASFPPVVVFYDSCDYWLADGFHRYHAHVAAGKASIAVESRNGSQRDAQLYSFGVNAEHGLRRSNADKRKAVMGMLDDSEWSVWSDRKIAEACGVTHPFVSGLRKPKVVTVTTPDEENPTGEVVTVTTPDEENPTGEVVTVTTPDATGKPALTVVQPSKEDEYTDLDAAQDQVKDLQDALVVANMGDVAQEDKGQAATLIAELRARIKALEQTLRAVTISRDTYQAENVQLRNQINRQRREIDKVTGRRTA